jgi:hypothetical protein
MLKRVSWSAVATIVFMLLAIGSAGLRESTFAVTFALCAIAWAVLSLKERT